jgi:hypothetical protein
MMSGMWTLTGGIIPCNGSGTFQMNRQTAL